VTEATSLPPMFYPRAFEQNHGARFTDAVRDGLQLKPVYRSRAGPSESGDLYGEVTADKLIIFC
jgi:hypothetical protein